MDDESSVAFEWWYEVAEDADWREEDAEGDGDVAYGEEDGRYE